jgi:hypothetical protein
MLRAFVGLVVKLHLLISLLLLGVFLIARAAPKPPPPPVLTLADGTLCEKPCLFGIRPQNRLPAAMLLAEKHPAFAIAQKEYLREGAWLYSTEKIRLYLNDTSELLVTVKLAKPMTVRDLMKWLGRPDFVYTERRQFRKIWFFYGRTQMMCTIMLNDPSRLKASDWVTEIELSTSGFAIAPRLVRWHGFTYTMRYR